MNMTFHAWTLVVDLPYEVLVQQDFPLPHYYIKEYFVLCLKSVEKLYKISVIPFLKVRLVETPFQKLT